MPHGLQSDADIERVVLGMLDCSLPKQDWTHAAHFAATLWLLRHRPEIDLQAQMPLFIQSYNASVGGVNSDTEGYHESITQASLRAARAFLEHCPPTQPLHEVLERLTDSPLGRSDWLLDYWSKSRLFSVEARRSWVEPDLRPLPF